MGGQSSLPGGLVLDMGEQLRAASPMVEEFFALKRRHDPDLLFMNSFYSRYAQEDRGG